MKKTMVKVYAGLVICLFPLAVMAQQTPDITGKINLYSIKKQAPVLFIHFDKNVYSNNENVWFTGYFFNLVNEKAYKTLSVALIKDDDHSVVMDDRFIISNKLAFGNMLIPDSVGSGNYSFIAYTNHLQNGQPDVLFSQPVTIKSGDQLAYTASLNPIDTGITAAKQKIMLLVNFTDIKKAPLTVPISYYVGNSAHPVIKGEVKTQAGQYIFNIPSKLLSQGNNRLHAQLKYNKKVKEITIDLPAPVKPASVRFYPEGGNLVAAVKNTVGWEAKSFAGSALKADAMLYEDNKIIDTLHTNSYGMGRFTLTPKAGSNYYIKLYGVKKDTLYKLPQAINNAPAIIVQNAVANNVLLVSVSYRVHEKLHFIIHNYKQLFADTTVEMTATAKRVRIFLDEMPKGLNQLTVTDSLGHPFAERLFFAHYNQSPKLQINTDLGEYAPRQKVNLKIKLNATEFPDSGLVSIACVQQTRFELNKQNDIESYFYLKHDLGELPLKQNYLGYAKADKQYLEDVLLIKGWRRYTWTDLLKTIPADTVLKFNDLAFNGKVVRFGNKLKKPVLVINFNHPLGALNTDNEGKFIVSDDDMVVLPNKKVRFMVNNDKTDVYQISLSDPYTEVNKKLAQELELEDLYTPQQNTQEEQVKGFERDIQLKEVNIAAKKTYKSSYGLRNACGDYVCRYNILNCVNHRFEADNRPPIVGQFYFVPGIPGLVAYNECDPNWGEHVLQIKGIYAAQEFYPSDYSKDTSSMPDYVSTIYWKYLAKVTSTNEAEFSFYTSDISGKFKIVVQGRTANDMIYGEKTINVVKPK